MLRPYLTHTEFPPAAEWPAVGRAWPEDVQDLQAQYFLLMSRVRKAQRRRGGRRAWHRVEGFVVRPIRAYLSVERLVRQRLSVWDDERQPVPPRTETRAAMTRRVAALISDCLGRSPLGLRIRDDGAPRPHIILAPRSWWQCIAWRFAASVWERGVPCDRRRADGAL